MGHTACGAIKGAIDNVQLGSLTGLPETIKPAVAATFVDAVARTNVQRTIDAIRRTSTTSLN
jgi:carbonic anhydrase